MTALERAAVVKANRISELIAQIRMFPDVLNSVVIGNVSRLLPSLEVEAVF